MLFKKYEIFLQDGIYIVESIAYTISFIIITLSIFRASITYVKEYNNLLQAYIDTRLDLGESVSLSLAFILGVEILKLFYIKSYKQLIIVISLVGIKLLVSFFLSREIDESLKKNSAKPNN
jgi:uncharacterized membrane protein